ncbi:hypothetical protein MNBD_GAMMA15-813 [hydrothermal vent metagenome]|uniref:Dockerin domain-containing protein n=1 Tax=hydrothermal vent metagenome TaxID=652676 RepID=A0A3B0YDX9_9ZZZZ
MDANKTRIVMVKVKSSGFCYSFCRVVFTAFTLLFPLPAPALSNTPGDLAPYGNPDGVVNAADYLILQRMVLGQLTPTPDELFVGDVAPLGNPDNTLNAGDLVVLMRAISGQIMLPQRPTLDVLTSPVNTPTVSVSGTALAGVGVNIYVNNVLSAQGTASASTGDFNLSGIAVAKGTNSISAREVPANGVAGISSRTITVVRSNQPQEPILNLISVSYAGGGLITISGSAGAAIGDFQVNISTNAGYTGSVTANADGSFSTTFAGGGASSMSLQTVDEDSVLSVSVSRGIGDAVTESINTQILAVWTGFGAQLDNGNAAAAENYFSVASKTNYARIFAVLGNEIQNLTGYWTQAIPIVLKSDYAEYAVKQTVNGQTRLHIIGFSRDSNGQWVIEQL